MRERLSMRIVMTNVYGDMGGGEFALLNHAVWLVGRGCEVHVFLFSKGPFAERLCQAGCKVHVIDKRLGHGPRSACLTALALVPRLAFRFWRIRPDYILAYTLQELPFVVKAGRLCGIPVVYREQGTPPEGGSAVDWRHDLLPRLGNRSLAGILPTTRKMADHLRAMGLHDEKLRMVYLGIDAARFQGGDDGGDILAGWGVDPGTPLVGIFGRLIEWKGQRVFLDAIARMANTDTHALVVGGPQLNQAQGEAYESALREQVEVLGIGHRVHFTGFQANVPQLMAACDVVCHASRREPFGLVITEAMMCGKAVVASDVSGPREIVVPGETGFLCPVGDHKAMAGYLDRLFSDNDLRDRMGQAGRKRALEMFDLDTNLKQLDDAINGLLAKRR